MATQLDKILQNFVWRIEQIAPTSTLETKLFRSFDPWKLKGQESSGLQRGFFVTWAGSEADLDVQDGATRTAKHRIAVSVIYAPQVPYLQVQQLVVLDRHDLLKQLRNPDSWKGYSDSNPTDELGLNSRFRTEDSLDAEDRQGWVYQSTWECTVYEVEYG